MIHVLLVLILVGVLVYLVHNVIPMDARIRLIFDVVVVLLVVLWLLNIFGVLAAIDVPVPRLR